MTKYLPPNLFALFEARPPVEWWPAEERRKKRPALSGLGSLLPAFHDPPKGEPSPAPEINTGIIPTLAEIKQHKRQQKQAAALQQLAQQASSWDPKTNPKATSDAYKTLFVGRLAYSVDEAALKREFEHYGRVKSTVIVRDEKGKSRGYGFVEYEDERDMQVAYDRMDGARIEEKRIVVDVERGRTVSTWKPRKFGGGLGGTRNGNDQQNNKTSGRFTETRAAPAHESRGYNGGGGDRRDDRGDRYRGGDRGGDRGYDRRREDYGDRSRGDDYHRGDRRSDHRDYRDREREYRGDGRRDYERRDDRFDRRDDDRYRR